MVHNQLEEVVGEEHRQAVEEHQEEHLLQGQGNLGFQYPLTFIQYWFFCRACNDNITEGERDIDMSSFCD